MYYGDPAPFVFVEPVLAGTRPIQSTSTGTNKGSLVKGGFSSKRLRAPMVFISMVAYIISTCINQKISTGF